MRLVVVQNDHINAGGLQGLDFARAGRAAVDGQQEAGPKRLHAPRNAFRAESVTLLDAQRQKTGRGEAVRGEQLRQDGEGGDAVDIVIAVEDDALAAVERRQEPIDRGVHLREQKGVGKATQLRVEKGLGGDGLGKPALGQEAGDGPRQV